MKLFLYLSPFLFHLIFDSIRIIVKRKFINHFRSSYLSAGVGVIAGIILLLMKEPHWWAILMAMLCYHFAFFSFSLNVVRMLTGSLPRKFWNITYLNSPSDGEQNWWDKVLEPIPPHGRLMMWIIIALAGVAFEFYVPCIINGTNCP